MDAVLGSLPTAATSEAKVAWRALLGSASARYRGAGHFAWRAAAGKLRFDPVFRHIVAAGLIARHERLLDIGCGRGLLLSLLVAAEDVAAEGRWPASWPPPPLGVEMTGIELINRDVAVARAALGSRADVVCGDMRETPFMPADVVVVFDVLHYITSEQQDRLLARVRQALRPGGRLLLRIGDAAQCGAFRNSQWVDRIVLLLRGQRRRPLVGRSLAVWRQQLESLGFAAIEARPMSQGTPFANLLLVARVADADRDALERESESADNAFGDPGSDDACAASKADARTSSR